MNDDELAYTEEPVRGHLFVGAITDDMIERALRAAYDAFPQRDHKTGEAKTYEECYGMTPLEHADDVAEMRAALAAALNHSESPADGHGKGQQP